MQIQEHLFLVLCFLSYATSVPRPAESPQPPLNFGALEITPDRATIINNCDYPVYIIPTPANGCPDPASGQITTIEPKSSWSEKAAFCGAGNTSLKVYKDPQNIANPMQFEYGKDGGKIWYNLSFIDCKLGDNNPDLSLCAGYEGGLQIGSSGGCKVFWCGPGENCCDKGYCDPVGTAARGAFGAEPNTGCEPQTAQTAFDQLGITAELCAASK